jgi:predicted ATP-binding protein involved in virulence
VADLETQLNDLKAAIEQEQAQLRTNVLDERGKPVAQGVIQGRISKQEQQIQEQVDYLGRQQNRIVDQLNTAYNVIGLYMNFADADYDDAVQRYESEFNRNMAVYGLIADARRDERDEQRYQQQVASANLQTYMNALTSGNLNYNDLSADQKAQIAKLESQAGAPVGLTSSLQMKPDDQVLFTSTNDGITQVGFMDASGKVRVESYGTSTKKSGTGSSLINLGTNTGDTWKVVGTSKPNNPTLDIYDLWSNY